MHVLQMSQCHQWLWRAEVCLSWAALTDEVPRNPQFVLVYCNDLLGRQDLQSCFAESAQVRPHHEGRF